MGFRDLPDFNQPENYLKSAEMAMEDDYGMIDGIINNGPREPAAEKSEARATAAPKAKEKRPSILERLKQPLPKQAKTTAPHRSAEMEI